MRRLSVALLATTIVSLAAAQPSEAASAKAIADDNCAMAKGDAAMVLKARFDLSAAGLGDQVPIPVYRIDRTHLLPRAEVAMHRHARPDGNTVIPAVQPVVALAAKGKTPLPGHSNDKEKAPRRAGLPGGFEAPVSPVLTGLLLSAYA